MVVEVLVALPPGRASAGVEEAEEGRAWLFDAVVTVTKVVEASWAESEGEIKSTL